MALIIPDPKEVQKVEQHRKREKKMRAVRSPAEAEQEVRKHMTELWMRVLFPVTREIEDMVARGATAQEIGYRIEEALHRAAVEYGMVADNIIDKWRMFVSTSTRMEMERGLRKSLGIDTAVLWDDPSMREVLSVGSMEFSQLIKTIPQEHLGRVAQAVADNFAGRSLPEGRSLLDQIKHLGGVSERRAKVIARDQTSKLTGLIVRHRQQEIRITDYIWCTSKDQRVVGNPSGRYPRGNDKHGNHYVMEGMRCRWDDATVYSTDGGKTWKPRPAGAARVHPGIDIQCRCYAEAIIDPQKIIQAVKGGQ